MNSEIRVATSPNGDVEILMSLTGGTYQLVWENTYGKGVYNPDSTIESLVNGGVKILREKHKLLFGTHLNGACPADCTGCPFGRTVMKEHKVLARPIKPDELRSALDYAKEVAIKNNLIHLGEKFSAGALLSGDPGYSLFAAGLIEVVSTLQDCIASRWSTIAPSDGDVFGAFEKGAKVAKEKSPDHVVSFQTSLHSTNPQKRTEHTGVRRLLSVDKISEGAIRIYEATGRKMTMAFVLHAESEIDPVFLRRQIPTAIASLRSIRSENHKPMEPNKQIELYNSFRDAGWDVVYMPASPHGLELHNMRAESK